MSETHVMYDPKRDYEIIRQDNKFAVKDTTDRYPSDSVLSGQLIIRFVDNFDTLEQAQKLFPNAQYSDRITATVNTYNHL